MRFPFWRGFLVGALWLLWPLAVAGVLAGVGSDCAAQDCYYLPTPNDYRAFAVAWVGPALAASVLWMRWRRHR